METQSKRKIFETVSINGETKRLCLSCNRHFIHVQDVYKHAASVHNLLKGEANCRYKEVVIEGKRKYECTICFRHFKQKRNITLHLNRDHTTGNETSVEATLVDTAADPSCSSDRNLESVVFRQQSSIVTDCFSSSESDAPSDKSSEKAFSNDSELDDYVIDNKSSENAFSSDSELDNYLSDQGSSDAANRFLSDISSDASYLASPCDSEFDKCMSDHSSIDETSGIFTEPKVQFSQSEIPALKILACFNKHNLTASACKDILSTMKHLFPNSEKASNLDMEQLYSTVGIPNIKDVHYCDLCGNVYSRNPDEFKCTSLNCDGLRYKGSLSSQNSRNRQPRKNFVVGDIQTQLKTLLQTPGILEDIRKCKTQINMRKTDNVITDITDGSEYQRMLNSENGFLANSSFNLTAILNTDGINLYSSSKVELWPIFLAINELSPALRFSRDNLLLVAIWQGKGKPPFGRLLEHLGQELELLYREGITVSIENDIISVKMAVVCGIFDLPAKASVLNMTYFNGADSCVSCEDPGLVVKQGKGHARCYPYRERGQEYKARVHDEVVQHMRNGTERKRIKGFKGTSGLLAIPSYNLVQSTVPDYMHGILLGITSTLLSKWFSPAQSGQPYFIGKQIQTVSKRLQNIKPPLSVERLPCNLEKHFASLKATELQMWLLFYAGPCLIGILAEDYLKHFASLSEAVYILLGDRISVNQIQRAKSLLREFYSNFEKLYGQGSCGLNVHNACIHLTWYVEMWGPIWAWSCFPFEDANAAILQSVHGTGNVTKQIFKKRHVESVIRGNDIQTSSAGVTIWKTKKQSENCDICGKLKPFLREKISEQVLGALPECLADESVDLKLVDRIRLDGKQFCSKKYSRLQRRVSYIILYSDNDQCLVGSLQYFIYCVTSNLVYAVIQKFISDTDQRVQIGKHLVKVKPANAVQILPADKLIDTLVYINVGLPSPMEEEYVACMPSSHGRAILK